MSGVFTKPKIPEPIPPANPAQIADGSQPKEASMQPTTASLVSTSTQGLKKRASTERRSLIGGA